MTLVPGARLGAYEVLGLLGEGGMGQVYRARDTRLGREVAVKVLSGGLAADPKALARFEAEARAVAALSHPGILALYDVGEEGGVRFVVTELLEGETLRAALGRGALSPRRVLEVAAQVAEALAAAHEKGIVHRDVKPENVFLTRDGRAKVLDFGLARARGGIGSSSRSQVATVADLTEAGTLLGTVSYMSPEQARGAPVDFRTDQFSLGVVLYEALAGRRPFEGQSAADVLAAIVRDEPVPLDVASPRTPRPYCWTVERLLSKEPGGRYDSTRDLARELASLATRVGDASLDSTPRTPARNARRRRGLLAGAAVAAIAVAAGLGGTLLRKEPASAPVAARFELTLPEGHSLTRYQRPFALSPDGKTIVYSSFTWSRPFETRNPSQLFVRPVDSWEARALPGTEGAVQPVFSPDGLHVAFSVRSDEGVFLRRVPVAGGPVTTVCACEALWGVAWARDGHILFGSYAGPVRKVSETGGAPEAATALDPGAGDVGHRMPNLLPDGRTLLYTAVRFSEVQWDSAQIVAQAPGAPRRTVLVDGGTDGRWVDPGYLVFARDGKLLAAPFDAASLRIGGPAVPIVDGISHSIHAGFHFGDTGAALFDAVGDRLFAWVPGGPVPEWHSTLVWVDPAGRELPGAIATGPHLGGRVAPDGASVLAYHYYPGRQVELVDSVRLSRRNVTFGMNPAWAVWGPGPGRITFTSDHDGPPGIYSRRLDAPPDEVETLWKRMGVSALGSWSPDGKELAFVTLGEGDNTDIWVLAKGGEARPLVATRFQESHPEISPDGRWILYVSSEPGREEVFLRPLSGGGAARQVSVGGGLEPLWSRDGRSIFYRGWLPSTVGPALRAQGVYRVRVTESGEDVSVGAPEKLFEAAYATAAPGHSWDVAPDGRFLFKKEPGADERRVRQQRAAVGKIRLELDTLRDLLAGASRTR